MPFYLTIRIVTQTMKHLGIAYILFFTEPMKVLALVLGSKLTNHWGIVLAFFVYIHFVPNLKFGAKVYIFINVRKTALSDCLLISMSIFHFYFCIACDLNLYPTVPSIIFSCRVFIFSFLVKGRSNCLQMASKSAFFKSLVEK